MSFKVYINTLSLLSHAMLKIIFSFALFSLLMLLLFCVSSRISYTLIPPSYYLFLLMQILRFLAFSIPIALFVDIVERN